jgi:two-component system response regulator AlgR
MNSNKLTSIFIVDDENLARERLKRLISQNANYQIFGEAENGEEALALIPQLKPDIVLLDIRMPGTDGLAVAEKLSAMAQPPAIIFCTAYDEYAVQAFKYNAINYLLKPVHSDELSKALSQATQLNQLQIKILKDQPEKEEPSFVAHSWEGHKLIPFNSIYFFKSDHKYLTVVHHDGETLSDQTLKELEQQYPKDLVRVHRNTLVSIRYIEALTKDKDGHYHVKIKDAAHLIPVSRRHVSELKQRISSVFSS